MGRIPRVAHRAELHVGARPAVGELVQIGLAQDNGACTLQVGDDRGVCRRHPVGQYPRASRSTHPSSGDIVFDGDRHPVQQAGRVRVVSRTGRAQGALSIDGDERAQRVVQEIDAL